MDEAKKTASTLKATDSFNIIFPSIKTTVLNRILALNDQGSVVATKNV